jgi:uncharacterized protein (TIGR00661 family)
VNVQYGFHFSRFDSNIFTPVIRKQIRQLELSDRGHYTVYLPAYDDERLYNILSQFKKVQWQVFSKHNKQAFQLANVSVQPLSNEVFIQSMASCTGMLCGAGFETPAEALFLQKKLMVIPMKNQYEQQCNAAALRQMGVPVIKKLHRKHAPIIYDWLEQGNIIPVDYPDMTEQIIDQIIRTHYSPASPSVDFLWDKSYKVNPV